MTTLDLRKAAINAAENLILNRAALGLRPGTDELVDAVLDALSSLPAQAAGVKGFPVLNSGGATVDWRLVADHGAQANKNHYQTVQRLAERGGLAWSELYAVLHDKPFQMMDTNDAITACRALEARYLSAIVAPSQPAAVGEVEATISDEELRKALRHRASLPETTPTDSYVMMKAERRIGAIASNSEPAMVRICPERDGRCPHGIDCPFAIDRGSCDMIASRAALRSTP